MTTLLEALEELQDPIRAHVLPKLPAWSLARLRASCTSLCLCVDNETGTLERTSSSSALLHPHSNYCCTPERL